MGGSGDCGDSEAGFEAEGEAGGEGEAEGGVEADRAIARPAKSERGSRSRAATCQSALRRGSGAPGRRASAPSSARASSSSRSRPTRRTKSPRSSKLWRSRSRTMRSAVLRLSPPTESSPIRAAGGGRGPMLWEFETFSRSAWAFEKTTSTGRISTPCRWASLTSVAGL